MSLLKFIFVLFLVSRVNGIIDVCTAKPDIWWSSPPGKEVARIRGMPRYQDCQARCDDHEKCFFWSHSSFQRVCVLMEEKGKENFNTEGGYHSGEACGEKGCIAGGAIVLKVTETGNEKVEVRSLKAGDTVRGMDVNGQESDCKVVVSKNIGIGRVVGDFTPGHFIIGQNKNKEMVVQESSKTQEGPISGDRMTDLYDVFTDCPVVETANTQLFTPISSVFCGSIEDGMSWKDYKNVYAFVMNAMKITGPDTWLTMSNYVSNPECHDEDWKNALPHICSAVVKCGIQVGESTMLKEMATENDKHHCDRMKAEIDDFINCHMGGNAQAKMIEHTDGGSMGEMMVQAFIDRVSERETSSNWWFYAVVALSVSSLVVGGLIYRNSRKNQEYVALLEESN